MKKILSIVLMAVTLFGVFSCNKDKGKNSTDNGPIDGSSIYLLSYTKKAQADTYLGTGSETVTHKAVLKIEAAKVAEKGNRQVIGVRCDIGEGATNGKVFMAYELGNNIAEKEFTYKAGGSQYVIFDAPVNIEGGKDIYVGYEATGSGYFIGAETSNSTLSKNSFMYWDGEWVSFKELAGAGYGASIEAICVGGNYSSEKQHDVAAENLKVTANVRAGETVNFSVEVRNAGIKTTGNVKITCKYGSETVNESVATLRNGESKRFNFTINGIGLDMNKITAEVSEDGVTDENNKNDKTTADINVFAADAPERVCILIEEFTSQSCPNCPDGIANLRDAIEGMQHPDKVAWVAHHSGFKNDIFTLNAGNTVASKLGVNFAPACIIDRMAVDYGQGVSELAWHPGYATSALLDELASIPANATIAMNVSLQDSTLIVDVNGMSYPNDCYITVLVCQNGIVASQSSGGSNFVHNEVVRAFLTAAEGDKLTLDGDKNYTAHFEYPIPATIKGETSAGKETATDIPNMYVVAFVHGKTSSKSAVYNAIKANIINE